MSYNFAGAPCVGRWELFDSPRLDHHAEARALCQTCPHVVACVARLEAQRHYADGARPGGTWGGKLIGKSESVCGSDSGYHKHKRRRETPCEACRQAHREYDRATTARRRARAAA